MQEAESAPPTNGGPLMPLKWWDHGACINYRTPRPVVRLRLPAALATTLRPAEASREVIAIATDVAVPGENAKR